MGAMIDAKRIAFEYLETILNVKSSATQEVAFTGHVRKGDYVDIVDVDSAGNIIGGIPKYDNLLVSDYSPNKSITFSTSVNTASGFSGTPKIRIYDIQDANSAIERLFKGIVGPVFFCQYQVNFKMDYYTQYLVGGVDSVDRRYAVKSGNTNGISNGASAPIFCPVNGILNRVHLKLKGAACSTGTPITNPIMRFELWSVGYTTEGTLLGTINIPLSGTIGTYGNTSINTNFDGYIDLNIPVSRGNLLGLKFISLTGNGFIVSAQDVTVGLEVQGDLYYRV